MNRRTLLRAITVVPVVGSSFGASIEAQGDQAGSSTPGPDGRARLAEPIYLADTLRIVSYWVPESVPGSSDVLIFGEVESIADQQFDAPVIAAVFYDAEGNVLGMAEAFILFQTISPNRPMPFAGDIYEAAFAADEVDSVAFHICNDWPSTASMDYSGFTVEGFEIEDVQVQSHAADDFQVVFKVRNSGGVTGDVLAVAAFFDSQGRYVGNESADESYVIPAGKTGTFQIRGVDGFASWTRALEFIDDENYTFELWAGVDEDSWAYSC